MATYPLTNAEVTQINNMNEASQRADMGDVIQDNQEAITALDTSIAASGSYAASASDASASTLCIETGETGLVGYIVNVVQTGSSVDSFNVVNSGSNLDIKSGGTWTMAEDDLVTWMVF